MKRILVLCGAALAAIVASILLSFDKTVAGGCLFIASGLLALLFVVIPSSPRRTITIPFVVTATVHNPMVPQQQQQQPEYIANPV